MNIRWGDFRSLSFMQGIRGRDFVHFILFMVLYVLWEGSLLDFISYRVLYMKDLRLNLFTLSKLHMTQKIIKFPRFYLLIRITRDNYLQ